MTGFGYQTSRRPNGSKFTVSEIKNGKVKIKDVKGRQYTIPPQTKKFGYDYYCTSHRGQGQTVDKAIIVATKRSFPAVNDKQFYVSTTRGRKFVSIYTNDKEGLKEKVSRSGDRELAVERVKARTKQKVRSKTSIQKQNKPLIIDK